MKRLAVAAAAVAVLALAACSHSATPAAAPAGGGTVTPPVSCSQQYRAWAHGPGKGLMPALRAVSSAEAAGQTHALTASLQKAKPTVARAARHPVPACADPRGYWSVLVMHVNAAAGSIRSASSVRAAMKDVPRIERQLTAELKQNARATTT